MYIIFYKVNLDKHISFRIFNILKILLESNFIYIIYLTLIIIINYN